MNPLSEQIKEMIAKEALELYPITTSITVKKHEAYTAAATKYIGGYMEAIAILKELVELKDMKDKLNEFPFQTSDDPQFNDYHRRNPVAWQAARELLSTLKTINKTGE